MLISGSEPARVARSRPLLSISRSSGDPASRASRVRIRVVNCCAAFRVKVNPSTASGATSRLATIHTTRAAMVSVFPAPAPATTRVGPAGAAMTAACSSVGGGRPRVCANSPGVMVIDPSPAGPHPVPGSYRPPGSAGIRRCAWPGSRGHGWPRPHREQSCATE